MEIKIDTKLSGLLITIVGGLVSLCGILIGFIFKQFNDNIKRLEKRIDDHLYGEEMFWVSVGSSSIMEEQSRALHGILSILAGGNAGYVYSRGYII